MRPRSTGSRSRIMSSGCSRPRPWCWSILCGTTATRPFSKAGSTGCFFPASPSAWSTARCSRLSTIFEKILVVTSYGGSRFRSWLMGDPPRKIAKPHAPRHHQARREGHLSRPLRDEPFHASNAASLHDARGKEPWIHSDAHSACLLPPGSPKAFCAAVRDAAVRGLEKAGHEIDLLDLYAEGFDPVMPADERRRYNEMKLADHPFPDHARRLKAAEGLIFVYPTWWYGLPAMLKGWLGPGLDRGPDLRDPRRPRPDQALDDPYPPARRHHHLRRAALVVLCHRSPRQAHHPCAACGALCAKTCRRVFHGALHDGQVDAGNTPQISCRGLKNGSPNSEAG